MLKRVLKSILLYTPYRVIRARDANRFQAIEECLVSLAKRGFNPRRIVDGGANVGDFAKIAASIFGMATVHLVEPQLAYHKVLAQLTRDDRFRLHAVALGSEDAFIDLAIDPAGVTKGAHVLPIVNLRLGGAYGCRLLDLTRCLRQKSPRRIDVF